MLSPWGGCKSRPSKTAPAIPARWALGLRPHENEKIRILPPQNTVKSVDLQAAYEISKEIFLSKKQI